MQSCGKCGILKTHPAIWFQNCVQLVAVIPEQDPCVVRGVRDRSAGLSKPSWRMKTVGYMGKKGVGRRM